MNARLVFVSLVVAAWLCLTGCQNDDESTTPSEPLPSVSLSMYDSVAHFLIPDSAAIAGNVEVLVYHGEAKQGNSGTAGYYPASGFPIHLILKGSAGFIEWLHPALGCTTDTNGRVHFRVVSAGEAGRDTIVVHWNDYADSTIVRFAGHLPGSLHVRCLPDTVFARAPEFVSVTVQALLLDTDNRPVPDIVPEVSHSGEILYGFLPTDSAGIATAAWTLAAVHGVSYDYCLVRVHELFDLASVTVIDTTR
jgi:hypothetical protein